MVTDEKSGEGPVRTMSPRPEVPVTRAYDGASRSRSLSPGAADAVRRVPSSANIEPSTMPATARRPPTLNHCELRNNPPEISAPSTMRRRGPATSRQTSTVEERNDEAFGLGVHLATSRGPTRAHE